MQQYFCVRFQPYQRHHRRQFDFVAIAIHEIGHALGFRSGVDIYDANTNFTGNLNTFTFLTQLDLFRYSAASTALGAIPEPETWAMLIVGFGFVGGAMRRRTTKVTYA